MVMDLWKGLPLKMISWILVINNSLQGALSFSNAPAKVVLPISNTILHVSGDGFVSTDVRISCDVTGDLHWKIVSVYIHRTGQVGNEKTVPKENNKYP